MLAWMDLSRKPGASLRTRLSGKTGVLGQRSLFWRPCISMWMCDGLEGPTIFCRQALI